MWNPGHGEWMKQDVKEKAWNNIGVILQCEGVDVSTWWNINKDRYVTEHQKMKSGSGSKILSARMQWLMTRFSFYSKVVTHHQKPVVSVKASIAQREGRDPSPEPEDDPDDLSTRSKGRKPAATSTTSVDQVVSQIQ